MCKFYKLKFLGEERQYNDYGCKTFFHFFTCNFQYINKFPPANFACNIWIPKFLLRNEFYVLLT